MKKNKKTLALGIKNGKVVRTVPMEDGGSYKDYDFGDVDSVIELPDFGIGGTDPKLGEIKPMEPINFNPSIGGNKDEIDPFGLNNMNFDITSPGIESATSTNVPKAETARAKVESVSTIKPPELQIEDPLEVLKGNSIDVLDGFAQQVENSNKKPEGYNAPEQQGSTQYYNPYGGVSLEEAFAGLGRGLKDGDNHGLTALYGAKAAMGTTRSLLGGLSAQNMSNYQDDRMEERANKKVYTQFEDGGVFLSKEDLMEIQNFKNGGEMEISKKLTGDFVEGLANETPEQAVVEAEDGEFILHNDGQVVEIQGKRHESGGEKMTATQVQEGDRFISNHLKASKEIAKNLTKELGFKVTSKDTYASIMRKYRKDLGLTDLIDEKESIIKNLEKNQHTEHENTKNLNLQFQSGKLKELEEKEAGLKDQFRAMGEKVYQMQEDSKPKENNTEKMNDGGKYGADSRKRFQDFYRQAVGAGYTGDVDPNAEDLGAEAGKLQAWMVKNKPELVVDYFKKSGQPLTAKGLEMIKDENPALFKKLDLDPTKDVAEYTPEEKKKLTAKLMENGVGDDFWLEQFHDNKWEWRAPQMGAGVTPNKLQGIDADPLAGYNFPDIGELMNTYNQKTGNTDASVPGDKTGKYESSTDSKGSTNKDRVNIPNLPDQSVLPPNAMEGHLKNTYRMNRIEASKVSPEEALANIGSQFQTGADQANQRPDAMRAALLAQMLAGTQQQSNTAVTQANMQNQQSEEKAQLYNAQAGDKEMYANNAENLRFEQIQMRAKENTDMDWRDYMDYNRKVQLNNYNTVNQMNLMNELFDKFELVDGQVRQKSGDLLYAPTIQGAEATKTKTKKG